MESGRDEEEEALEDSLEEASTPVQVRRNGGQKPPGGRAPTMTIEIVRVGRPIKVLSLLTSIISMLLFVMGTAGTSWIYTDQRRIGLFQECTNTVPGSDKAQTHLWDNCATVTEPEWDRLLCTVLDLVSILLTLIGTILLTGGMISLDVKRKTTVYKVVLVDFALAFITMAAVVVLFPIQMSAKIKKEQTEQVSVGWSCVANTIGCLLLVIAIILLALDRKSEEITYKETIHRFPGLDEEER
ncbi:hypothetical protein FGIG_03509 [Fasciola gigantica]|uniref:Uncharacterized protein n=1 Tax=Fasciola gigantica TaxID=46835 RepID=A0A504YV43_FASGI|nr:hypothetical protein FGIG_03509 [Fasciola gigantica]